MNPKDGFDFNEICGHFLIKAEGGAKNYESEHPLPLAWRPFTVVFVQRKGYGVNFSLKFDGPNPLVRT